MKNTKAMAVKREKPVLVPLTGLEVLLIVQGLNCMRDPQSGWLGTKLMVATKLIVKLCKAHPQVSPGEMP